MKNSLKEWKSILPAAGLVILAGMLFTASPADAAPPNILIILTDDMRYDQMSHEDHPYIQTPNLDRLANEGMRMTNAYVTSPLCGPCRSSIFTGRQPSSHGRLHNFLYDLNGPYLPKPFRDAGYTTAFLGKMYEGDSLKNWAMENALDHTYLMNGPYWPDYTGDPNDEDAKMEFYNQYMYYDQYYLIDGKNQRVMGHQTDVIFTATADFATKAKEAGKPFWIMLNPFAPHTPLNPTLLRLNKYLGYGLPDRPNMELDKGVMARPGAVETMTNVHERTCEMIEDVDSALGVLMGALEQSGQLDSTLIIFTSDNGALHGEHGYWWKMAHWQEASRIPLLVRYPSIVQPGTTSDALVSLADLLITSAELGGVSLPADSMRYGRSFLPVLMNPDQEVRPSLLTMQYPQEDGVTPETPHWAAITDSAGWKLVVFDDGPERRPDQPRVQLYNIKSDPYEMTELSSQEQEHVERLAGMLYAQLDANGAPSDWLNLCCRTTPVEEKSPSMTDRRIPVEIATNPDGGFMFRVNTGLGYKIDIVDLQGAVVESFTGKGGSEHIWNSRVPAGVYTAKISTGSSSIARRLPVWH